MIRLTNINITGFVMWLNMHHETTEDVQLCILHGFDSVATPDGRGGFAVYRNDGEVTAIYIADPDMIAKTCELSDRDKWETTLANIAHEYRHHYQATVLKWDEEKMLSDEAETDAESWAEDVCRKYQNNI